jgi:hypothetical protein
MRRRNVIVLVLALAVALGAAQYFAPATVSSVVNPTVTRTTGTLKEVREPSWFSSSRARTATVVLADGTSVDASIIPGCEAQPGEVVRIDVLSTFGQKTYIVVGSA